MEGARLVAAVAASVATAVVALVALSASAAYADEQTLAEAQALRASFPVPAASARDADLAAVARQVAETGATAAEDLPRRDACGCELRGRKRSPAGVYAERTGRGENTVAFWAGKAGVSLARQLRQSPYLATALLDPRAEAIETAVADGRVVVASRIDRGASWAAPMVLVPIRGRAIAENRSGLRFLTPRLDLGRLRLEIRTSSDWAADFTACGSLCSAEGGRATTGAGIAVLRRFTLAWSRTYRFRSGRAASPPFQTSPVSAGYRNGRFGFARNVTAAQRRFLNRVVARTHPSVRPLLWAVRPFVYVRSSSHHLSSAGFGAPGKRHVTISMSRRLLRTRNARNFVHEMGHAVDFLLTGPESYRRLRRAWKRSRNWRRCLHYSRGCVAFPEILADQFAFAAREKPGRNGLYRTPPMGSYRNLQRNFVDSIYARP